MLEALSEEAESGTRGSVGRSKTPVRELVRALLETDPELGARELLERYPGFDRDALRNALARERRALKIRCWREHSKKPDEVVLTVRMSRAQYDRFRAIDARVARLLVRSAVKAIEKK